MAREADFAPETILTLAKRASYICSNPDCRCLTLAPSMEDENKTIFNGIASHIISAGLKGPRNSSEVTPEQKADISNGIFLCANCSVAIDKNNGLDFSIETLQGWKAQHELWIRENLNKSIENSAQFVVDGEHHAKGEGEVTGLHIKKPAFIKPGTISTAEGTGTITATKIG
jgi:hypothetical protein